MSPGTPAEEEVVLLDEAGHRVGTAAKAHVHHQATPLHLAFSCYVLNRRGEVLMTQRAHHKPTWPGVWTNSFCGHPAPDEDLLDAVRRRAGQELGLELGDVCLAQPAFRYQATMDNGVRENELCPVFVAAVDGEPRPDPAEVAAVRWLPWNSVRETAEHGLELSPWCLEQLHGLPTDLPAGCVCHPQGLAALPHAAREAGRGFRLHHAGS